MLRVIYLVFNEGYTASSGAELTRHDLSDEVQTRYVLRVRLKDLDKCVPEGSRQMHFNVSVVDFQERNRVFLMNGEFGCRDTLVRSFGRWLSQAAVR